MGIADPDINKGILNHLIYFVDQAKPDAKLKPSHISIYLSLILIWYLNKCKSPFAITRSQIMQMSKIHGKATYHKRVKELQQLGYISYEPTFHPLIGSYVGLPLLSIP